MHVHAYMHTEIHVLHMHACMHACMHTDINTYSDPGIMFLVPRQFSVTGKLMQQN